jgi:hypothetical protein
MENGIRSLLEKMLDVGKGDDYILDECIAFYSTYKRHYYYEITLFLIEKMEEADKGNSIAEESIEFLTARIKKLIDMADDKCSVANQYSNCKEKELPRLQRCSKAHGRCREYKSVCSSLNKLYDHIQLDHTRLQQIREQQGNIGDIANVVVVTTQEFSKQQQRLDNEFEKLGKSIDKEGKRINTLSNQIEEKIDFFKKQAEDLTEATKKIEKEKKDMEQKASNLETQLNNVYTQVVSILGIFTAIVFAMFGGVTMLNTIVQTLANNKMGFVKGMSICILIGLAIFNILYLLLYAVSKLINKSIAYNVSIKDDISVIKRIYLTHPIFFYFNFLCFLGLLILAVYYNRSYIIKVFNLFKYKY